MRAWTGLGEFMEVSWILRTLPCRPACARPIIRQADEESSVIYRFADAELDTERYELRHQGAARPVEPQVFDLLRYLVENRDRTVTKDELYKAIWQGRFVSESALSSGIKAARQAVNDTGNDQRIIRTLHGRGFRFVAPVEVGAADRQVVD